MSLTVDQARWSFDVTTRALYCGAVPCDACRWNEGTAVAVGRARVSPWQPCSKCKGTGKRGNGQCRECKYFRSFADRPMRNYAPDYRPGMVPDHANGYDGGPCTVCEGTAYVSSYSQGTGNGDIPDDIRAQILASLPVTLNLTDTGLTRMETLIGTMPVENDAVKAWSLTTVSDYGRRFQALAAAHQAGTLTEALDALRAEFVADLPRHITRAIDICRVRLDDDTLQVADRVVILVSRDGVRVMAVTDKPA